MRARDIEMSCGFVSSGDEATDRQKELRDATRVFAKYIEKMKSGVDQNAAIFSLRRLVNDARKHGAE